MFVLEIILHIANYFCFSYKSTSCASIGKAVKVPYCDNSEHNWDTLSHPACMCFGYSADIAYFPKHKSKGKTDILPYVACCC